MTTAEIPTRNDDQRLDALDQANRVRSARAHLKRTIGQDPEDARRVILNPTSDYRGMRLRDMLLALPQMGPQKVDRLMFSAGLTPRQREQALEIVTAYLQQRRAA
jgi:putative NADPH-quinone reductase